MAKFGYVIGSGGGSVAEPTAHSSEYQPIYVNPSTEEFAEVPYYTDTPKVKLGINIKGSAASCTGAAGSANSLKVAADSTADTLYVLGAAGTGENKSILYKAGVTITGTTTSAILKGAAWNDYAEFRRTSAQPGQVVIHSDNILVPSTKRLQKGATIVSDTYGFIIGEDSEETKGIAVAGRVLAYIDKPDKVVCGDALCTGKNGKLSKMNRLEIILFPDRIVGYVDEIPTYSEWNNVKINGRIWVKVV